jgi:uncharacterized protein involved in outer membrane biogenesis
MKRILKWLAWSVAAMALFLLVLLFNPGLVRGPIQGLLAQATGYSVMLDGELAINIGTRVVVSVKDIKARPPGPASQTALLELDRLQVALVTSSVFSDTIVIEDLVLAGLKINARTNAAGEGNWQVQTATPAVEEKEEEPGNKRLVFRKIQVTDADIRFHNGVRENDHDLQIGVFKQQQSPDGMLLTSVEGRLNGRPVSFSGEFGPYENLLNGRDVSFDIESQLGGLALEGKGLIDDVLKPARPLFNIGLKGADIDEITAMLGIDDLGAGGFLFEAKSAVVQDRFETEVNGNIGDVELNLSVRTSNLKDLDVLDMTLNARGPNIGAVTRTLGIQHWPDKPFNIDANVDRLGGTLNVSGVELSVGTLNMSLDASLSDFPSLNGSRIKLNVAGDDVTQFHELIGIEGPGVGAFELNGKLDKDTSGQDFLQMDLVTSMGSATLSGKLGAAPGYTGSQFHLRLDAVSAHRVADIAGVNMFDDIPFSLEGDLVLQDKALQMNNAVLLMDKTGRLELDGNISFEPGLANSRLGFSLSGENLDHVLRPLLAPATLPARPYQLDGTVKVQQGELALADIKARYAGMTLASDGVITTKDQLLGSRLDFEMFHENLSTLSEFEMLGDAVSFLYPGQALQAGGRLEIVDEGLKLSDISGRLGSTDFSFDTLLSREGGLAGSSLSFQFSGADTHKLLSGEPVKILAPGAFDASGRLRLGPKTLNIDSLEVNTTQGQGQLAIELGWPIGDSLDLVFSLMLAGQNINNLVPPLPSLQLAPAAFKLDAAGKIQDHLVSVNRFEAFVGDLNVSLTGDVEDEGQAADILLKAVTSDLSTLGALNGKVLPAIPLNIRSGFQGNTKDFSLANTRISMGESRLNGNLDVSFSGARPVLKITAQSELLDLTPFIEQQEAVESEPAEPPEKKERLIPAIDLPLAALEKADAELMLDFKELRLTNDSLTNLVFDTRLESGILDIREFSLNAPTGSLKSSFSIHPTADGNADVKLVLSGSDLSFNISRLPKEKVQEAPHFDIEAVVTGSGHDTRKLAATANGFISVKSTGGTLEGVNLSVLDTFILEDLFKLVLPESKDTYATMLTCAAAFLTIKDGLVSTTPAMAFTTDRITIVSTGKLALNTEKMHFNFNATPNNALKISASELVNQFILIGGTLAKPSVGLDPGKTLIQGGAALTTGGLTLLAKGLWDRVSNANPLCEEMLKTEFRPILPEK